MAKDATARARIDSDLKAEVEDLFKQLGLSTTEAITMFYHQVKLRNGLPFDVVVPNITTEKTFEETDKGENLVQCQNADDMFERTGSHSDLFK
ncbi:MAG: type II toxin-antitoxin system RelB/DinJ family antitoxin [Cyanobacteria bacterium P01_A01_bin.116]